MQAYSRPQPADGSVCCHTAALQTFWLASDEELRLGEESMGLGVELGLKAWLAEVRYKDQQHGHHPGDG